MAKIKSKKKRMLSDLIIEKRQNKKKSINPFEVHINKQKFQVLGRKMKHDRGFPGLARAKSIKKREETLLQEYKMKDRANRFLDRRIGERNSAMTKEDRIAARYAAERLKAHKRKAIFNLGDDEVLTHKGRSIAEIEHFENPSSDEELDEYSKGKLDANFVEEAHFGGGLLKKTDESKGRVAVIDQLIAESKKRKAEKQEAKEKTLEKTEQLDVEWRELMPMVAASNSTSASEEAVEKRDGYDLLMNQLRFEARGTPSDRLKSENELAAEEAQKLKELEDERLQRMRGEDSEISDKRTGKRQHRSADDLDDGFDFDQEEEFQVMYDKEGKLISKAYANEDKQDEDSTSDHEDYVGDEHSEEEEIDENDDDDDDDDDKTGDGEVDGNDSSNSESEGEAVFDLSDMKQAEISKEDSEQETDEEEQKGKLQNNEVKKKLKTSLKNVEAGKDVEKEKEEETVSKIASKKKVSFDPVIKTVNQSDRVLVKDKSEEELEKEEEEKKKMMEQALQELPYTFKIPDSYEELYELLENKNIEKQIVIIERMIKCNHPSLNEKNKQLLNKLFAFLLQLLNDADHLECWTLLDNMAPFLFELTQFSPSNAAYCLTEILSEKHSDYLKKKHRYPSFETLVFLKLVPILFPTSDKRHPITTPALVFITEMLHQCQITTRRGITTGLFLVTLLTQYVKLSKRISPEAVNFLCGVIHLATPISSHGLIVPPFQQTHKFLFLQEPCLDIDEETLEMFSSDLSPKSVKIDNQFRVRSIYTAVSLFDMLIDLWKDIVGNWLIFSPIVDHITALEVDKYPSKIGEIIEKLSTKLSDIKNRGFEIIIKQKVKPKALRLYDPNIEPVYDNRKRKYDDKKSESKKLLANYKREMKGALREIRRDRSFLANVRFKEISKSDSERMKKVKEIYSWGKQQQAELNKLDRQKRRKK